MSSPAVGFRPARKTESRPDVVKRIVERIPTEFFVALFVTLVAALAFARVWLRERRRSYDARREALLDPLTGIPNRLAFEGRLSHEWRRAHRYRRPLGVLILDMDNLKHINDRHGHAAGDHALRSAARLIAANIREADLAARLSGDEFVVLCPETDVRQLEQLAAKLRFGLDAAGVATSVGIAERAPADRSPKDVLERADAAMYGDKAGRTAGQPPKARPALATAVLPAPHAS